MGVPSLFRWVHRKYPGTIKGVSGHVDNLYLDLNGIIHPCCHPQSGPEPESEPEMFRNIFGTIDHLVEIVRPRQLLYIAVDGVAPRAKMNQQRERRFKTNLNSGGHLGDDGLCFDSNCITPGTPFMFRLHEALISYIESRLGRGCSRKKGEKPGTETITSIPAAEPWSRISVLYSGCDVPGEGEHKVFDFIRNIRGKGVSHVICGLDADLIFLGLATHEENFRVLREDVFWIEKEARAMCSKCQTTGHSTGNCTGYTFPPYIYLDLEVLRNYLQKDFSRALSGGADFERMLDDWVFMCFFVGNDFLPSIPSMDIRVAAIETLTRVYVERMLEDPGHSSKPRESFFYLTKDGEIDVEALAELMRVLASEEKGMLQAKLNAYIRQTQRRGEAPREEDLKTKLFEDEGRAEYYARKLHARTPREIQDVCAEYIRGLAWVLRYYYKGCPSWLWYYPLHFAPLASDIYETLRVMVAKGDSSFIFAPDAPRRPLEQVMAVLPPSSAGSVPEKLRRIFTDAPDNYPGDVKIDMFGKTQQWQGVALLPFLDYEKLVISVRACALSASLEDIYRNTEGADLLAVPRGSKYFSAAEEVYTRCFIQALPQQSGNEYCPGTMLPYARAHTPGTHRVVPAEKKKYVVDSVIVRLEKAKGEPQKKSSN